jgi:CheY-like chemotaxis protein
MAKIRTALLVDDDNDDHYIFRDALNTVDPMVILLSEKNGDTAIRKLDALNPYLPDIVFLDLNMPRMGGMEFLRVIKKDPEYRNIPVYIYSTSSRDSDIEEAMAAGAADYFVKPGTIAELIEIISKALAAVKEVG